MAVSFSSVMHARFSVLHFACRGRPLRPPSWSYACSCHQFSTHSFVLDPKVHGKTAFQSNNPGKQLCPTSLYRYLSENGQIDSDAAQLQTLEELQGIYESVLQGGRPSKRSLYIYGPAGSGKSMVMDLFHFCLEQHGIRSKRQHFHEFLYEMHRKLHQLHLKQRNVSTHDFIRQISSDMGRELDVMCFDELAITTIQDCTLLVPLFSQIFKTKICLVTTSNRHPDNLYEDGLNRHLYLPEFLGNLHANAKLASVKSEDYREREFLKEARQDELAKVFFSSHEAKEAEASERKLGLPGSSNEITIGYGRKMVIDRCSDDKTCARFEAKKLFGGPPYFGADDYNAICEQFDTIVLDGLWVLAIEDHNEAKRLTNFLDCAYEMHVRVVCVNMEDVSAEALFENLLPLETLSLKEIIESGKNDEREAMLDAPPNLPGGSPNLSGGSAGAGSAGPTRVQPSGAISLHGGASGYLGMKVYGETNPTGRNGIARLAQQKAPGDQDTVTSSMAEVVKSIKSLPIATSQQSCYFLSQDHKDWSVESKIVHTSARTTSGGGGAGVSSDEGLKSGTGRDGMLSKLTHTLPNEPDQSGRSKPFADGHSDSFEDSSSEQHSVKGVFVAAVASLHETGFAAKRAVSRLHEMQTTKYISAHSAKRVSM